MAKKPDPRKLLADQKNIEVQVRALDMELRAMGYPRKAKRV